MQSQQYSSSLTRMKFQHGLKCTMKSSPKYTQINSEDENEEVVQLGGFSQV